MTLLKPFAIACLTLSFVFVVPVDALFGELSHVASGDPILAEAAAEPVAAADPHTQAPGSSYAYLIVAAIVSVAILVSRLANTKTKHE